MALGLLTLSILGLGATPVNGQTTFRVASMNVSLYGDRAGEVKQKLAGGSDAKAINLAKVINQVQPDVLLLCEIDHDADGSTLDAFADGYLNGAYPYRWSIPTNTGVLADVDINGDGKRYLPVDAWGFGKYPGQYAMSVLSKFPIDQAAIRTFQEFRWADLPEALRPIDPVSGEPYHSDSVWKKLRLSSKNHVDVPIEVEVGGKTQALHLLASHPTPPVFDGKEDRNGKRNHDEIRFWIEYISNANAGYLVDDSGVAGGLPSDASFVIAGDLNSDPNSGDSIRSAIANLISHERVNDVEPKSDAHGIATALFGRRQVRVDYVLPSSDLSVVASEVVWPVDGQVLGKAVQATDHRMVWVDISLE
ncbi:endonuclease/exonuclease/phosphatase family protein [Neorhodopirellula lusitana]|uniref:endonuclease/exonuclease/phosphatase family protein n=1 Tax=Neorhodopirellula lusitana TaxID=445327 RepID=UPI00384F5458